MYKFISYHHLFCVHFVCEARRLLQLDSCPPLLHSPLLSISLLLPSLHRYFLSVFLHPLHPERRQNVLHHRHHPPSKSEIILTSFTISIFPNCPSVHPSFTALKCRTVGPRSFIFVHQGHRSKVNINNPTS